MRRLAAVLLALLGLLGAALWFVPRLLDWEPYRAQLAELASSRLGRPVTIGGRITLTLLPQPRVEAAAVALGPDADGLTVTARAMRLRLDLGALLTGRLEPREVALVGGDIRLPWPPSDLPSFRPPPWLTTLDARLEDSRLRLGTLEIGGLNASLVTGGLAEALTAEGSFAWRGAAVRFAGQLGRAGFDGAAPLDLSLAAAGATLSARGVLSAGGGFVGRVDAAGPDLATLLPSPPGAFRASGRLTAGADLLAADDLTLDLAGQPARGAITLRLAPQARLDIALSGGRLDLEAWVAALRQPRGATLGGFAVPVSVDLSAEATSLAGLPLRRLRGAFFLEGDRLTVSDLAARLPGETAVEVAGASAGDRLELAVHFAGPSLRDTLGAIGLPLAGTDPARLRAAEGRFRLVLQDGQGVISDLAATVDGARVAGAGTIRPGPRLALGLGLTLDRLDLDGLLPDRLDGAGLAADLGGFDLNLRLAAEKLSWRGLAAERGALDATLEGGRLALRRLAFRLGDLDISASGAVLLGASLRVPELTVEASGASGAALLPLLPAGAAGFAGLLGQPVALRFSGGGVAEAVTLTAEGDLGELRLEAAANIDPAGQRSTGTLTLRHPGAPRLLGPVLRSVLGVDAAAWLGQGSFSLIATLSGQGRTLTAEHLDLVAGTLRTRAQLTLAAEGARPKLTGRILAERLPLPEIAWRSPAPLGLAGLAALDADLAVEAERIEAPGLPPVEQFAGSLRLAGGSLRLEAASARLGGGLLQGVLGLDATAQPPQLRLDARLADMVLAAPLLDLPFDIGAGRLEGSAELTAAGHSMAALAATLSGDARIVLRDGVLVGFDLAAVQAAAAVGELAPAEAALRHALSGGATAFERLELAARLAEGRAVLAGARLAAEGGAAATAGGEIDLLRDALDLRLAARPVAEAPEIALRLTGPVAMPRRLPEMAPFLRWRAAH